VSLSGYNPLKRAYPAGVSNKSNIEKNCLMLLFVVKNLGKKMEWSPLTKVSVSADPIVP
jgi:hypothetical protein